MVSQVLFIDKNINDSFVIPQKTFFPLPYLFDHLTEYTKVQTQKVGQNQTNSLFSKQM